MKVALTHSRLDSKREIDRYVHDLAGRLLDAGHEVHVFCRSWDPDCVDSRIALHRIPDRWKSMSGMNARSYEGWVKRHVSRTAFDVVHGFDLCVTQDVYTVAPGAGDDPELEARRFAPGAVHRVIASSNAMAERLRAHPGLESEQVVTLYPAVDAQLYHPRNRLKEAPAFRERIVVPKESFLLLCEVDGVGTRGAKAMIEAARLVDARGGLPGGRSLRVVVIGEEEQRIEQRLSAHAKAQGVWRTIKFYGTQERPERWHCMADLFVQATPDHEFGGASLRAMASGAPVLVAKGAGAAELVREGENGFLLDPPDSGAGIADCMAALADDPERAARISAAGRATAEEFAWERHLERLIELYEQVVALKRAATP